MGNLSNLYISQSFQSLIHLGTNNTASAALIELQDGYGNNIGVAVNTAGDLFLSGSLTASLQQGYLYVGGANGKTTAFATSSLVATVDTGSLVTTASFNSYTQSTNIRLNNLESTSASVNISISNLNSTTSSFATSIANLNTTTASLNTSVSNLNTFTQSQEGVNTLFAGEIDSLQAKTGSYATTGSNNFIGDQNITGNISALSASFTYLQTIYESSSIIYSSGSNQFGDELTDVQTLSGSVRVQGSLTVNGTPVLTSSVDISGLTTTASFNAYTQSNDQKVNSLINATSSYATSAITASSLITASAVGNTITFTKGDASTFNVSVASTPIDTASFATTGSNTFVGNQTISGSLFVSGSEVLTGTLSASALRVENNTHLDGQLRVTNDAQFDGHILIQGAEPHLKLRDTSGGGGSAGYDVRVNTGSFEIYDDTHNRNVLSDIFNSASAKHTTSLTSEIIVISGSTSITLLGNVSASIISASTINGLGDPLAFSTSVDSRLDGLEASTASLFTSASLALVTASVSLNTITFTKGDGTTFPITVNTGSGGGGGSTDTGSLMVTGSIAGNILTFTKGDASTFNLTIPSATGSVFDTGSFATTGSNTFRGTQTIETGDLVMGNGFNINAPSGNITNLSANNTIQFITEPPAGPGGTNDIKFYNRVTSSFIGFINEQGGAGNEVYFEAGKVTFNVGARSGSTGIVSFGSNTTAIEALNTPIKAQRLELSGALTASLQQGYAWVGDSSGVSTLVATSSFGGAIPAGLYATLGANTFTGSQTITGTSLNIYAAGPSTSNFNMSGSQNSLTFTAPSTFFQAGGNFIFNNNYASGGSGSLQFSAVSSSTAFYSTNGTIFGQAFVGSGPAANGFVNLNTSSGSLVLSPSGFPSTLASLSHLSGSSNTNNVNLIFKNNTNTGTTIVSGSNNIFTNPNTPTTGYIRYVGGNNNLYLNNTNGVNSQITASATRVSGTVPAMNNNIFYGTGNFSINQATNPGTHTYSQNIIGGTGTTTINALGFTGSLNFNSNYNNGGTFTINAASASVAEIATGISGSGTVSVTNNINNGGTIICTSPHRLLTTNTQTITTNILAGGTISITNISASANVNAFSNIAASTLVYSNAGAAGLGLHRAVGQMNGNYGSVNLIASASAIAASNNISPSSMAVINRHYSGSFGSGSLTFNNNQIQGANNTYTVSGSYGGTGNNAGATMLGNGVFGANNTIFTNVEGRVLYIDFRSNLVGGQNLILTGSNNNAITASGGGYFGRFNADDSRRNGTAETVFFVGTGTSEGNRKTGFLIDSGSNTYVEGTLNVSGSTTITGSLTITGSASVNGSQLVKSNQTGSNIMNLQPTANPLEFFYDLGNGGINQYTLVAPTSFTGSVQITSGSQLTLPTGSNQQAGTAVLDGGNPGTVTVSNSLVTTNSIIMLTKQTSTASSAVICISAKGGGSFTIVSNAAGDTDTVGWFIINNS